MKSFLTLLFVSNALFINTIYANESTSAACNAAVNQQNTSAALSIAKQLLKQNSRDKEALICQGRALSLTGDLQKAISAFELAKKNSQAPFDHIVIHILMGNAYQTANQANDAQAQYQNSAALAKAQKNANYERISYNLMGDLAFKAAQYQTALDHYTQASALTANDNERGESYENIALSQFKLGALDEALAFQIKAYMMHEKVGTLDQFAHSSITMGEYYRLNKNFTAAENALNKIIKFAKEQGGAYYEAKGTYTLAKVKRDLGETEQAEKLIAYAIKIAQDTNDTALLQEIKDATPS